MDEIIYLDDFLMAETCEEFYSDLWVEDEN